MKCCPNYIWNSIVNVPPDITPPTQNTFVMEFVDINTAIGGNINDVNDWNAAYFFAFDAVTINGNTATFTSANPQTLSPYFTQGGFPAGGDFNTVGIWDYGGYVTDVPMNMIDTGTVLTDVYFPAATAIGDGAFSFCSSLNSVNIPNAVTIGANAFQSCGTFSTSFAVCTSVGDSGFEGSGITVIGLPACTTIGSRAFASCTSLTSISADNLVTIGNICFLGCTSLTTLSFPSCDVVGYEAFKNCTSLTSVDLPACTGFVAKGIYPTATLQNCDNLTLLNVPSLTTLVSPGEEGVFIDIDVASTLTININSSAATCNAGNPDGDLVAVDSNNPGLVTINYI